MTNDFANSSVGTKMLSRRTAALAGGWGVIVMTVFYFFAELFVFQRLLVPGDTLATAENILANESLFRIGILGFVIVIVCDIIVAWAFYFLFKPTSNALSLLSAWFRLVYSVIFLVALFNYLKVLELLGEALTSEVVLAITESIESFGKEWSLGFVFFGIHLTLLGYLSLKSKDIPKIMGVLLLIAGIGYLINTVLQFIDPEFNHLIFQMTGWGELIFVLWLLFVGIKQIDWTQHKI
jgi:preprotein translocase subunit Sss1